MQNNREQVRERVPFGQLLRELRIEAGLSQEALAELARMSTGGVGVLERGIRRAPQRETLELLASALNLSTVQREEFEGAARRAGNARRRRGQPVAVATHRHNLPFSLTSFVGRENAVGSLHKYILDQRLITLTGTGGVGKTRLAIETGHSVVNEFADGVWLVELATLADAGLVPLRIAETLGVEAGTESGTNAWIDGLAGKRLLLILDNSEHLLQAVTAISKQLLERCPHLHILTTSREPLRLTGERVIRLRPLAEPEAIEMFLDRARNASLGFQIAEEDAQSWRYVRTIVTQLDGIPFAIELAAARVSTLSLKTLAENIGQRLKFLGRSSNEPDTKHATMRALIDWSYDLLTPEEQAVFEELAVFSGGCTVESAIDVCSCEHADFFDVLDRLTSLVEKSLVVVDFDVDEPRYNLLETSREYAFDKLVERGDHELTVLRHAAAYLRLAERLENEWSSAPNRAWTQRARVELENWRAAMHWTLGQRRDVLLGQRLAGALRPVWTSFAIAEGRRWCELALEAVDETTPRDVVAKLAYACASIAFQGGELKLALTSAERAANEYRILNDNAGVVRAETIVGRVLIESGKLVEGETRLLEVLEIARGTDDPLLLALVHNDLGLSRGMAGDIESARAHVADALAIAKAASAERVALIARMVSAEAHFRVGDMNAAVELGAEAVDDARALGDEFVMMRTLSNLAGYLLAAGKYDEARNASREALNYSQLARGATTVLFALQHLALLAALQVFGENPTAENRARAARLFGFIESRIAALGARGDFSERQEHERLENLLKKTFSPPELDRFTLAGSVMSEAEAIREAMAI